VYLSADSRALQSHLIPSKPTAKPSAKPHDYNHPQGGNSWRTIAPFMASVCDVDGPEASAAKIVEAAQPAVRRGDAVVVVAHNGPSGLGERGHDICGVDWK